MGLQWLIFFIGFLDLIGIWFGEDQTKNIIKKLFKKRLNYIFKY